MVVTIYTIVKCLDSFSPLTYTSLLYVAGLTGILNIREEERERKGREREREAAVVKTRRSVYLPIYFTEWFQSHFKQGIHWSEGERKSIYDTGTVDTCDLRF